MTIANCEVYDATTGAGIRLSSDNSKIIGCDVDTCNVNGVYLAGNNNIISETHVQNCQQNGILDEGQNNIITNNNICANNLLSNTNLGNIRLNNSVNSIIDGNILSLTTGPNNIRFDNVTAPTIANNKFINPELVNDVRGTFILPGVNWYNNGKVKFQSLRGLNIFADINVSNGVLEVYNYSSSAPTSGTWVAGDIVYRTPKVSGGYVGDVCTVDGTPGTWKGFGAIS